MSETYYMLDWLRETAICNPRLRVALETRARLGDSYYYNTYTKPEDLMYGLAHRNLGEAKRLAAALINHFDIDISIFVTADEARGFLVKAKRVRNMYSILTFLKSKYDFTAWVQDLANSVQR